METVDPDLITLILQIDSDSNLDSNPDRNDRKNDNNLTENESKFLEILCRDNTMSAVQVSEATGLSVATINRVYKSLKAKEYIARKKRTCGKWIIL